MILSGVWDAIYFSQIPPKTLQQIKSYNAVCVDIDIMSHALDQFNTFIYRPYGSPNWYILHDNIFCLGKLTPELPILHPTPATLIIIPLIFMTTQT